METNNMKVVILAGGYGTRISEESHLRPKPMIEIGEMPIMWHIMKYYSHFGYNDFIICCGYKGYYIKEYFADYYLHRSDITFDFNAENSVKIHNNVAEPWKVTLIDTGLDTMTGGRIRRIKDYIEGDTFMLTYGDGVSDVDINSLVKFHMSNKSSATITAIQPGGRYGVLDVGKDSRVNAFSEKKKEDGGWVNGGFMVLSADIFNYLENDRTVLEAQPFEQLAKQGKLNAFKHYGFWQCMDTLRDKILLDELIAGKKAPWIVWEQ
jgi:glucose-1-phosphate cytidylyltransferase